MIVLNTKPRDEKYNQFNLYSDAVENTDIFENVGQAGVFACPPTTQIVCFMEVSRTNWSLYLITDYIMLFFWILSS